MMTPKEMVKELRDKREKVYMDNLEYLATGGEGTDDISKGLVNKIKNFPMKQSYSRWEDKCRTGMIGLTIILITIIIYGIFW